MKRDTSFLGNTERYYFDNKCRPSDGWCQFDTRQDASYFGQWTNPLTLEFISFCEGDCTRIHCEDAAEYTAYMQETIAFYEDSFMHIDVGISGNRQDLLDKFESLELGKYTA